MSDQIPDNLDPTKLEIRIDAANKLFDELWGTVRRHLHESDLTSWEVVGCLDTLKSKFREEYMTEQY